MGDKNPKKPLKKKKVASKNIVQPVTAIETATANKLKKQQLKAKAKKMSPIIYRTHFQF